MSLVRTGAACRSWRRGFRARASVVALALATVTPPLDAQSVAPADPLRFITRDGTFACGATVDSVVGDQVFLRRERAEPGLAIPWTGVVAAWQPAARRDRPHETRSQRRLLGGTIIAGTAGLLAGTLLAELVGSQRGGFRDHPGIIVFFTGLGMFEGLIAGALFDTVAPAGSGEWQPVPLPHVVALSPADRQRIGEMHQRCAPR